jgi:hypothetical protein
MAAPEAASILPGARLIKGAAAGAKALTGAAKAADKVSTALVRFDPMVASRNRLGRLGSGYAVTPGGRTITAHAADRIVLGGAGRPPTTLSRVDQILDNPTSVRWNPTNNTVQVFQGKAYVAVRGSGPQHIVTVMVPK